MIESIKCISAAELAAKQATSSTYSDPDAEVLARLRRIETKVTRLLTEGGADQGVKVTHTVSTEKGGCQIELNSGSCTVTQIKDILLNEPIDHGEFCSVYDNGRYLFTVLIED